MLRNIVKIGGIFTSFIGGIALFVFGEGILISSILFLGPLITFIIFYVFFSLITYLLINIYFNVIDHKSNIFTKIKTWIVKKENELNIKKQKFMKYGKFISVCISSITAGPIPTSIFICVLGYNIKNAYIISLISNLLFLSIWIIIYSGGIKAINYLLEKI